MGALDPTTDKFYQGKYLSEVNPKIDREAYEVPLSEPTGFGDTQPNYQALTDTSNPEELLADPEDFCLEPEEVQAGCDDWVSDTDFATGFTRNPIPNFAFYGFYEGNLGRGRFAQTIAIAISDFYLVPIESGSASSREILEFC